jgi:serine protease Do
VVDITAVLSRSAWQTSEALGTGVIYTSDGLIITNNHVLTGDGQGLARTVSVTLASGARMSATIVGRDPAHDLAVLRVRAKGLHPAVFDTSLASRKPGTLVVALGNDQVLSQPVVNGDIMGLVGGVQLGGRSSADQVLATSVPLMQGDSGGPLVDPAGRVIGINFAELTGERAGLALPASLVLQVTRKLVGR